MDLITVQNIYFFSGVKEAEPASDSLQVTDANRDLLNDHGNGAVDLVSAKILK